MALFFLGCAILAGIAFFHPYIFYPLSLRAVPEAPLRIDEAAPLPTATLVFCAYNEAKSLPEKIDNLRRIREVHPAIKFACYIDLSTDGTLELMQSHSDLIKVIGATERTGKALGMRRLAAEADTDLMIFTDANVIVEPTSVPKLLRYFSDPKVGGVCGSLHYTNPDESPTASTSSAYWRLEELIKQQESRSGSTMGADGSIFATRLAHYPEVPGHLLDDFIVSMSIVFSGLRLISAPDVIAYEKSATVSKDEFRRKRRISCRAYSSHRHIWPSVKKLMPADIYKYVSHRVVRWYGGFMALASAAFFVMFLLLSFGPLAGASVIAAGAILATVAVKARLPLAAQLFEAVKLLWANTLGVVDSLQGKTYQTWTPPQSR